MIRTNIAATVIVLAAILAGHAEVTYHLNAKATGQSGKIAYGPLNVADFGTSLIVR